MRCPDRTHLSFPGSELAARRSCKCVPLTGGEKFGGDRLRRVYFGGRSEEDGSSSSTAVAQSEHWADAFPCWRAHFKRTVLLFILLTSPVSPQPQQFCVFDEHRVLLFFPSSKPMGVVRDAKF
jgi:hypothetical protein